MYIVKSVLLVEESRVYNIRTDIQCKILKYSLLYNIPVNPPPFRGSLLCKSLIYRMDWVSCAGDINLPHDLPPTKKSSTIKSWPTFCDQYFWKSWSKYYLRTKFQDGIDKPQKCQNVCYHPTHQHQSDLLILVLCDFIVQSILSSLLLFCYNLMIMNDYE